MSEPKKQSRQGFVTVVIPTYNRAHYIAETIECVLEQSYENIEILIVDDGSTDDTAKAVERFAPKVRYIWQQNAERGAARNHGLRLAKGEFVAFLDSDDLWLPGKLESTVAFFNAHPNVGLVYTDALLVDSSGSPVRVMRMRGPSGRVTTQLLQRNFIVMPTHVTRTRLMRQIGGFSEDRALSGSEDWEAWLRLSSITDFAYIPEVTAKYRVHPANTVNNAAAMQRSTSRGLELVRMSHSLTPEQSRALHKGAADMALVNAINYCSLKQHKYTIKFLHDAALTYLPIIFDPRFGYTVLRLFRNLLMR